MNKNKLCLRAVFVVLLVIIWPTPSQALRVTTDALALTPTTGIFTLDFDFVSKDRPYYIPIGAKYNLSFTDELNYVGYEFRNKNGEVIQNDSTTADFKTTGIVLSDLPIENSFYVLEPNTKASFTLVTLLTVPSDSTPNMYSLHFKSLPHFIGEDKLRRDVTDNRKALFSTHSVFLNAPIIRIIEPDFIPSI